MSGRGTGREGGEPARARINPAPYREVPHIEMYRVEGEGVRVRVLPPAPPAPRAEREGVERVWEKLLARNPRYYNGPLLSVVAIDFEHAEFQCRRDEFKRLCAQPAVPTGVRLLSVTGVVTARDASGREHVLLGRRGAQVRSYPGMWELGPAGGIPPPHASVSSLGEKEIRAQLLEEAAEEIGLSIAPGRVELVVRDFLAMSDDVVVRCSAGSVERAAEGLAKGGTHAWEYSHTRWVPIEQIPSFDESHEREIIGASRAVFRGLGWIGID